MARGRRRYWREYYAKKNKLQPIVGNPKLTAFREEMMRDFIRNSAGLIGELAREDLPAALAIQQMVDEAM